MAEKTKASPAKTRGSALDLPMAALAGGSVGFFAFAMPVGLFESLIGATGLPALLPAAQPPLGDTARFAFVGAAAAATFAPVWMLLRALGKAPAAPRPLAEAVASEPPRLRRADMHPDAPSRHPLRAGSDFGIPLDAMPQDDRGEPVDVSVVENVDFDAEWERPTPSFLQPAGADGQAEEEELVLDAEDHGETAPGETYEAPETYEAVSEAEPIDVPFWLPAGASETPEDEAQPEQDEVEQSAGADAHTILPFWAQQAQAEPDAAEMAAPEPTLDQLSTRLEGGLIRRKRDGRSSRPRGHRGVDDRLRGALDDLTKMTSRR